MSSKRDIKAVEAALLKRKSELDEELEVLNKSTSKEGLDPGDLASSAISENLKNSLQNSEFEEYKMITSALEMVASGEYGLCMDCKEDISDRRLESYPNAVRCLLCQEANEEVISKNKRLGFY